MRSRLLDNHSTVKLLQLEQSFASGEPPCGGTLGYARGPRYDRYATGTRGAIGVPAQGAAIQ